jgi:peptidoglycan hydrolase-like protein with peptidoglycan-binding domain
MNNLKDRGVTSCIGQMKTLLTIVLCFFLTMTLFADELTRAVQQRLKDQGFFYGNVDGRESSETSAALRRFQIRHGLKVTGQLDEPTLRSLGVARNSPDPAPAPKKDWNWNDYSKKPSNDGYDRQPENNRREADPAPNTVGESPEPAPGSRHRYDSYGSLFVGTVYEHAPAQVQENVLVAVQGELSKRGFYRSVIDGHPGPATSDAAARLQQNEDLPVTGRLDGETLSVLRALPGQRNGPPQMPEDAPRRFQRTPGDEPVYRGVPVN